MIGSEWFAAMLDTCFANVLFGVPSDEDADSTVLYVGGLIGN
jgi:hypothetical protein